MPFEFKQLRLAGLTSVKPKEFPDSRGIFAELYKESDFKRAGIENDFVQDNWSKSTRNVLRGLHYQLAPKAQGKLVTVIRGQIFDVGVDLRPESPTFLQWEGVVLGERDSLYVPAGFAHGFCVLSEETDVFYKTGGGEFDPELERGIAWNDPTLAIKWPIDNPILSEKDSRLPTWSDSQA